MNFLTVLSDGAGWMRWVARGLALLWAGWWVFFGAASGIGEKLTLPGILLHTTVPGLAFLVSALLLWRFEAVGAFLLIAEGLLIAVVYPMMAKRFPVSAILFVLATMALPPLLAGLLSLLCWSRRP
ncbi:MAG: hypothetical protein IT210_06135 [Armatimonadetes bacterium]|nr:hypothetical protein [Armatimonadota bacterium]